MRLLPAQRASPIFSCSLMTRVGKLDREFESSHPLQSLARRTYVFRSNKLAASPNELS